ncbi:GNAT family N-acetyltransferase [Vibrio rotiferianus]|uniref:GNAT family N-acetyltransferase n=1 Tax=Vibrio rotiferianus TaxID=190895 RepID=UPI0028959CB9|nr:GNAT family N-acetyltransferase [Vibrio rotiferianus]CAH1560083.1 GNAT family N-acetyltransferase [Vibrio rotiferianus]
MELVITQKSDIDAIYKLEQKLFGHHAYPPFFFRQAFDCWPQGLLIAKEEDQITGYVLMATSDEQNTHWILSLAVDSQHRGKGIARSLVENAIAKASSGSIVKLTVDPNNAPAYKLYTSLGFKVLEKEEDYFGDGEPRLVMALAR